MSITNQFSICNKSAKEKRLSEGCQEHSNQALCIITIFIHLFFFFVHLSLLTMTNPNQMCDVLLFVCSKMADETNLSSKLSVADRTREI